MRAVLVLAMLLLQLAMGDDLYWARDSNWETPNNWLYGRPPCGGEVANFASVRLAPSQALHCSLLDT